MLAIATSTAPNLTAQDRREPIRGSVELQDGAPWAGATVHLLSRPLALDERIGKPDELQIRTDAKGRFTAQLLVGRSYLAWAVEPIDGDRLRISRPAEQVLAGQPLTLELDGEIARRKLRFEGLDSWRARGEVVARVLTTTVPSVVVETVLTGDEWLLPALPGRGGHLELACGEMPLQQWPRPIDLRSEQPRPIRVRRGRAVKVRVQDDKAQPVANATLSLRTIDPAGGARVHDATIGQTDSAGAATVVLPIPRDRKFHWHNYAFGISAKGFAPLANVSTVLVPKDHDPAGKDAAITATLTAGTSHALVLRRGSEPFAAPVSVAQRTTSSGGEFVSYGDGSTIRRPAQNGELTIRRLANDPVLLVGATADLAPSPSSEQRPAPLHPIALLGRIASDENHERLTWQLDNLRRLSCRVDLGGVPMPHARLAVVLPGSGPMRRALNDIVTDRTGRIAILVPPDLPLHIVAWTDHGFAIARNVQAAGKVELALTLQPIDSVGGEVRTANDTPVPNATVQYYVRTQTPELLPLARAIQTLKPRTDAAGQFSLPLFPGLEYSVRAVVTARGEHYLDSDDFLVGRDTPPSIELRLRK